MVQMPFPLMLVNAGSCSAIRNTSTDFEAYFEWFG